MPFNLNLGGNELPLGLGAAVLFSIAGVNLVTKRVATASGIAFTLVFVLFRVIDPGGAEQDFYLGAH